SDLLPRSFREIRRLEVADDVDLVRAKGAPSQEAPRSLERLFHVARKPGRADLAHRAREAHTVPGAVGERRVGTGGRGDRDLVSPPRGSRARRNMTVGKRISGSRRLLRKWIRIGIPASGSAQRNPGLRNENIRGAVSEQPGALGEVFQERAVVRSVRGDGHVIRLLL